MVVLIAHILECIEVDSEKSAKVARNMKELKMKRSFETLKTPQSTFVKLETGPR